MVLLLPLYSSGQVITAFVGGGTTLGDGGPATAAIINDPCEVVLEGNGVMYIASGVDNRIRKIDNNGIITTIAGNGSSGYSGDGGPATAAKLNGPVGVALDSRGNVFFTDGQNSAIRKVDFATGKISTICGSGVAGYNGDNIPATAALLNIPDGICFDGKGNLFVADGQNNRVRKIDTFGNITTVAGTGVYGYNGDGMQATNSRLFLPTDVAFDNAGNLYVADGTNRRIRKVNSSGIISTFAGNGSPSYVGDGVAATNVQLTAGFIKFDHSGNMYCSDPYNYRVYKIDYLGILHWVAGNGLPVNSGNGGPAKAAGIYYPTGLALDSCDNLYIANVATSGDSDRIRKVTFNTPPCTNLGVEEINKSDITVYPNPISDELHIDVKINTQYVLLNITGIIEHNRHYRTNRKSKGRREYNMVKTTIPRPASAGTGG